MTAAAPNSPSVSIAFAYTSDPLVMAALSEFHIYVVNPTTHVRLSTQPIIVGKTAIPTITTPLAVAMGAFAGQMIEVVPVDLQGKEGITAYAPMYIPLPPVTSIAQVTS